MRFTNSVEMARVTLDPSFRFFGPQTSIEVAVTVRLPNAERIVHRSAWDALGDGQRYHPGNDMAFRVPVVDQQGWRDSSGNPVGGWVYDVQVTASALGRSTVKWYGSIAPTSASPVQEIRPADGISSGVSSGPGGAVNPDTGHIIGVSGGGINGSTTFDDLAASGA